MHKKIIHRSKTLFEFNPWENHENIKVWIQITS